MYCSAPRSTDEASAAAARFADACISTRIDRHSTTTVPASAIEMTIVVIRIVPRRRGDRRRARRSWLGRLARAFIKEKLGRDAQATVGGGYVVTAHPPTSSIRYP